MSRYSRQKRGKPKELPPTQLYPFNFPVELKEKLEEICWYERTTVAEKLRDLIHEEISRKKGEGCNDPLANVLQNNANKDSYSVVSPTTLDHYMRQVEVIESSCREDYEPLNEQFMELKKLKAIAFHHDEQTKLLLSLITRAEKKLCLIAKRKGLPQYNEWRDTSRQMGLSDEQIREVLEQSKKEGLKAKWEK